MSGKQCISFWSIFQTAGKVEGKYLQANVHRVRFRKEYENKPFSNDNVETSYTVVYFVIRYLIWITAYFTLSFVYRFALDNDQRRAFEVM